MKVKSKWLIGSGLLLFFLCSGCFVFTIANAMLCRVGFELPPAPLPQTFIESSTTLNDYLAFTQTLLRDNANMLLIDPEIIDMEITYSCDNNCKLATVKSTAIFHRKIGCYSWIGVYPEKYGASYNKQLVITIDLMELAYSTQLEPPSYISPPPKVNWVRILPLFPDILSRVPEFEQSPICGDGYKLVFNPQAEFIRVKVVTSGCADRHYGILYD